MVFIHVEKRIYHGLPDLMTKVAREELDELGDGIDECNVMYLPQVCMPSHRMSAFTDNSPIDF